MQWSRQICCHLAAIDHHPTTIIVSGCQKVSVCLLAEEGLIEGGARGGLGIWVTLILIPHIPGKQIRGSNVVNLALSPT